MNFLARFLLSPHDDRPDLSSSRKLSHENSDTHTAFIPETAGLNHTRLMMLKDYKDKEAVP